MQMDNFDAMVNNSFYFTKRTFGKILLQTFVSF